MCLKFNLFLFVFVHRIPAHRVVLAAASDFFSTMFCANVDERKQEIELENINAGVLRVLIEFCYTGVLQVTAKNVENLIQGAERLKMTKVKQICAEFLIAKLDVTNCIGINAFADDHQMAELATKSFQFVCRKFGEVSAGEEFKSILSVEKLKRLIEINNLQVDSEEVVLKAVASWISHDKGRKGYLPEIIKFVRCSQLDNPGPVMPV